MQKLLVESSYWISIGIVLLVVSLFAISLPLYKSLLRGIGWRIWIYLIVLVFLALVFRLYLAPHAHYVYYDEFVYPEIAKNMLYEHAFYWNPWGYGCGMVKPMLPQWPPGYFILLSFVFGIFGTSEYVSFLFSSFVGSLCVVAMFVLGFLLFNDKLYGLWMAFLLAIYPLHIKFSGSSSLEIISLLFITISFICMLIFLRSRDLRVLLFSIAMMALASQMRVENIVLLSATCGICLFLYYQKERNLKTLALALMVALFLFLPSAAHVTQALDIYKGWREAQIGYPFLTSLSFWFRGGLQPVTFTILSLIGLISFWRSKRLIALGLCAYLLIFLVIYTLVHRVDISVRDMQRFNLQICLAMIVFAVAGIQWIFKALGRQGILAGFLVVPFLLVNVYLGFGQISQPFSEDAQRQYEFILSAEDIIKDDSIVFAPIPASIISTIGGIACSSDLLVENCSQDWMDGASSLILFKDILFYYPDSRQFGQLAEIERRFTLRSIMETEISGKQIGFYLLEQPYEEL